MRIGIILISLAVVIAAYLIVAIRERNFVNILLPFVFLNVPAYYVLELLYQSVFEVQGSIYAYAFCYSAYALGVVAKALGYLAFPAVRVPVLIRVPRIRIPFAPFLLLIVGVIIYLPVMIEYRDLLLTPREIYTKTRTGYGIFFYLSSFLIYLALIMLLFEGPVRRAKLILFSLIALPVLYWHGSKVQLLIFFLILLYFSVFVAGWRVSLRRFIVLGVVGVGAILTAFYITLPPTMKGALAIGVASYSDYTRNATLVIDDQQLDPQFGRLTLESTVYALVPRAVFPDKPKDFGSLWLAKRYYPDWFQENIGAPAFGIGLDYADFGPFALIWIVFTNLVVGVLIKILVTKLRQSADAGSFVLLLLFMNVDLLPTGSGSPFVFYYCVALMVNAFSPRRLLSVRPEQLGAVRQ